ncbi:hypothetical protein [Bifidobacterium olomucense]|uniref:Uncharacterized protein n=1 Tax=Bifidobacterium olomucense TaxID=2675324 RepID=A0A7Y0EY40_9BIFI|nr:hypothetical protein [Bifidobacterium sp. DSM 109959]NMM98534.1 hypothetical protein [Bifidobacterium sp. DSM 109959]
MLAHFFQVVLFEGTYRSEEAFVGGGLLVVLVFAGGQFDGADEIGYLRQPIIGRRTFPVYDGLLRERVFNRAADSLGD